ncbi:class I SAM-dependent methyltransferase [Microbacterium sp. NPDC057944]|uniref:class I SAM-dependent methyltransferase n=1 Tax=Microbacterium sp. NPDC057944 TaxID=3346286 RepID=UPI0036DC7835
MKDWAGVGEAYSASYAALCAGTLPVMSAMLGPAVGRDLVDVGSGDGTLAAAWAEQGWSVTACEPERTMRNASLRRHPHIRTVAGRLPSLPFDDEDFDVAVANFVLNHVDSPRSAAAELRRVSRGAVIASIWTRSPSWLWAEVTERAGVVPLAGGRLAPEEEFERTPEGFERMLREAGLAALDVAEHTWVWKADPGALWTSVEGGVAGAGAVYASLGAADREGFRHAFDAVVAERVIDDLLPLEHTAAMAVSAAR